MSYNRKLLVSPGDRSLQVHTTNHVIDSSEDERFWANTGASATVKFTLPDSSSPNTPLGFQAIFICKAAGNAVQVSTTGSDVIGYYNESNQTDIYTTSANYCCWIMLITPGLYVLMRDFGPWTLGAAP